MITNKYNDLMTNVSVLVTRAIDPVELRLIIHFYAVEHNDYNFILFELLVTVIG